MAPSSGKSKPGHATRFQKGKSGNPKGRPRKGQQAFPSSYDTLVNLTLPATMDGEEKLISAEEALQLKTFNQALKGSRTAQRTVLKMIAAREAYFAAKGSKVEPLMRLDQIDLDPVGPR